MENRTEKGARIPWEVRDNREMGGKPMRSRRCKDEPVANATEIDLGKAQHER